jgi:hypothetical protein
MLAAPQTAKFPVLAVYYRGALLNRSSSQKVERCSKASSGMYTEVLPEVAVAAAADANYFDTM